MDSATSDPASAGDLEADEVEACTILHVDMDSFFASVEVLDDPSLAGKPVIVGGDGARGVVASCTYEARAFGIHSAMPSVEARRRCPHAVFVSGRYSRYAETSEKLHEVLRRFSPVIEPVALDEAFVDVAGARRVAGPAPVVAKNIRRVVQDELRLMCSVGVARSKLVAKLASRAAKPSASRRGPRPGPGVVVVLPSEELAFLHPLPVRALWGVGPATARRLSDLGVTTVRELAAVPEESLCRSVGAANGRLLAALARGDDRRVVEASREAKSVGHEETFAADLHRHDELHAHLVRMADAVGNRVREARVTARTVTIKVRYGDFTTITRSHTLPSAVDSPRAIATLATALLDAVDVSAGIRLLGVSVSGLAERTAQGWQMSFDDAMSDAIQVPRAAADGDRREREIEAAGAVRHDERRIAWDEVEAAVSAIRSRYGHASIGPAALVGRHGLSVKQRGDTQWGPSEPGPSDS